MKKTILLTAALAMAATGFAQEVVGTRLDAAHNLQLQAANMKMAKADANAKLNVRAKGPARAAADGVYYARPAGTFYTTWTNTGASYYRQYMVVPPLQDLTWTNMSANKASTSWEIAGNDISDYVVDHNAIISTYSNNGYVYTTPTITDGTIEYQVGESDEYYSTYGSRTLVNDMDYMCCFDDGTTVGNYAFGGLDNYNLFGSGNVTVQGTTYVSDGTVEIFPAPASPLYVDTIRVTSLGQQAEALPAGTTVYLGVYGVTQDEDGFDIADYNNVLGEFTCTAEDAVNFYGPIDYTSSGWGQRYYDFLFFTQKGEGTFGKQEAKPIVLNQKFAIAITGLSQTGVDVNIAACKECPEDSVMEGAAMLVTDGTNMYTYWRYGEGLTQRIAFHGVFDYIEPLDVAYTYDNDGNQTGEYKDFNVLTVPATGVEDGSQEGCGVVNKGMESLFYTEATVAFSWADEEGNENYNFIDTPDWLELAADADDGEYVNYGIIYVASCKALPAGTTGRAASVYLEGKGYTSKVPVIILQGDATIADAIENPVYVKATKSSRTYNINGQQVGKNFKGITIKDGKKTLVK